MIPFFTALFLPLALPAGGEGHVTLPSPGVVSPAEALVVELGCLNCHGANEDELFRYSPKAAPRIEGLGARRTHASIRRFLGNPHGERPGTSMPDLLAGLSPEERESTLDNLVHFLASQGGPMDPEPFHVTMGVLESGRKKFHELGCVACHEPQASLKALTEPFDLEESLAAWENPKEEDRYVPDGTLEAPRVSLDGLARRTTVQALTQFLLDPRSVRPSGRMPDMKLTEREARDIAAYLLREQAVNQPLTAAPGLRYAYYEAEFPDGVPNFEGLTPRRTGVLTGEYEPLEETDQLVELVHRPEHFAFVFTGSLIVKEPGTYTFRTESDDGSEVYLDGELVVDNGGFHGVVSAEGSVDLEAGAHSIRITYFEAAGGNVLRVHWSGPSWEERPLRGDDLVHMSRAMGPLDGTQPLPTDVAKVRAGAVSFEHLGCAACHDKPTRSQVPLALADFKNPGGCLGDSPASGVPRFGWSGEQAAALRSLLSSWNDQPAPTADDRVRTSMASQRCYACHRRDGIGGPHPDRGDYFASLPGVDLGEEGRIPPVLDNAGSKLERSWLHGVLQEGSTARPGLLTRMPQFHPERMGELEEALVEADRLPNPPTPGPSTVESVAAGRRLAGTQGFGCIQCHEFNGYSSLGINAVDLGQITRRIQYPWFRKLMEDPVALGMNSRMPMFWIDGKSPLPDVLDGDVRAQIDALWHYLDMGDAMQLPAGLNVADSAYEVEIAPGDPPRLVGVFMKGLSPRVVAVGTGDLVHYAFDVENSRLALAWRGRFFNARGTWEGRAGLLEFPPTQEVFELPAGAPFARLENPDGDWPTTKDRLPRLQAKGRRFDDQRRPIFRYSLGAIEIEEAIHTLPSSAGGGLLRRFVLESPEPVSDLVYQSTDGRRPVTFDPIPGGFGARFEERIQW